LQLTFSNLLYVAAVLSTSIPAQMIRHSSRDAMACDKSLVECIDRSHAAVFWCNSRGREVHRFDTFQLVRRTEWGEWVALLLWSSVLQAVVVFSGLTQHNRPNDMFIIVLSVTFYRANDVCRDRNKSLIELIKLQLLKIFTGLFPA